MVSLLKNTSYSFLSKITSMLFGVISSILFVRIMGVENYGTYNILTSIITLIFTFINLGIPSSILYFIPKFKNKNLIKKLLLITIIIGFISTIILFLISNYVSSLYMNIENFELLLKITILTGVLPFTLLMFNRSIFQGFQRFKYVFYESFLSSVLRILPAFLFILGYNTINMIIFFIFFTTIIKKLVSKLNNNKINLKPAISYSTKYYLSGIALFFFIQIDYILLGIFSATLVGFFAIAHLFRRVLMAFPMSINESLLPKATEKISDGKDIKNYIKLSIRYSSLTSLFLCFFIIFSVEPILLLLYGSLSNLEYIVNIIRLLIIISTIDGILNVYNIIPYSINKPKINLYANIFKAFTNTLLCIILIPTYNILGVCISLLVSIIIGYIVTFLEFKKNNLAIVFINYKQLVKYVTIVLTSTIPLFFLWKITNSYMTMIPMYFLTLCLFYKILKKFGDKEDKIILKRIKNYFVCGVFRFNKS